MTPTPMLIPVFPFPARVSSPRPHISHCKGYRNLNLFSIGYAFRPRLRTRLTQGRSALPWIPWIFGLKDSSPSSRYSFRHSLFMALHGSLSVPLRRAINAPLPIMLMHESTVSVSCFSPGHFRRRTSRPVSCYALFKCVAASEPTSWLSLKSHILYHLTRTLGP